MSFFIHGLISCPTRNASAGPGEIGSFLNLCFAISRSRPRFRGHAEVFCKKACLKKGTWRCLFFHKPLAQSWHARPEFYGLHTRFITVSLKCSSQVAPGQASHRGPQRTPKIGAHAQRGFDYYATWPLVPRFIGVYCHVILRACEKKDISMLPTPGLSPFKGRLW
jgi:hypothetical protein